MSAAALGAFGLFVIVAEFQSADRQFREASARHAREIGPVTVVFSDEGVSIRRRFYSSELEWPAFSRFQETRTLLLVYLHSGPQLIVPKRAVLDASRLQELRLLLGTHLSGPTGGFPVVPVKN